MRVPIIDLHGQSHDIEIPKDSFQASEIIVSLQSGSPFQGSRIALSLRGEVVDPERNLSTGDFEDGSTLVVFDYSIFPEKSYPRTDDAFSFNFPRFGQFAKLGDKQIQAEKNLRGLFPSPAPEPSRRDRTARDRRGISERALIRMLAMGEPMELGPFQMIRMAAHDEPDYSSDDENGPDEEPDGEPHWDERRHEEMFLDEDFVRGLGIDPRAVGPSLRWRTFRAAPPHDD